jgi:hypothetical protein
MKRESIKIGTFEINHFVHIGDPCYSKDVRFGLIHDALALSGTWHARLVPPTGDLEQGAILYAEHESCVDTFIAPPRGWYKIGEVAVDSGLMTISDATRFWDSYDCQDCGPTYERLCALSNSAVGAIDEATGIFIASTGIGDGIYPVKARWENSALCAVMVNCSR